MILRLQEALSTSPGERTIALDPPPIERQKCMIFNWISIDSEASGGAEHKFRREDYSLRSSPYREAKMYDIPRDKH